jgi:hypothetical protein
MSKKNFTFDNGRSGVHSVISRIDKFLVIQEIKKRGVRIEAAASIRKLLDHSPPIITIWGHHPPPNTPSCFFDATFVAPLLWPNVGGEAQHLEKSGVEVLLDSRMFRAR